MQATCRWKLAYRRSFEAHNLGTSVGGRSEGPYADHGLSRPAPNQSGIGAEMNGPLPNAERSEMGRALSSRTKRRVGD